MSGSADSRYRLAVPVTDPTDDTSDGLPLWATADPCDEPPSECGPYAYQDCPLQVPCRLLVRFYGTLAGVDPIILTYVDGTNGWTSWPFLDGESDIETPCGPLRVQFREQFEVTVTGDGWGGTPTTGTLSFGCYLTPGTGDPDFFWTSDHETAGGDCPGEFWVTVEDYTPDDISGSGAGHSLYWLALDLEDTIDGLPAWGTADCVSDTASESDPAGVGDYPFDPPASGSGSAHALYRLAVDTDDTSNGLPVWSAELDPCCDGFTIPGPTSRDGCCDTLPNPVYVTFGGSLAYLGTVELMESLSPTGCVTSVPGVNEGSGTARVGTVAGPCGTVTLCLQCRVSFGTSYSYILRVTPPGTTAGTNYSCTLWFCSPFLASAVVANLTGDDCGDNVSATVVITEVAP